MNDQEGQAQAAIRALSGLDARHKSFMAHIASEADLAINGGSVTTDGNTLQATALGIGCVAKRRPVAVDGIPVANEYTFITSFEGDDLPVWRLYLDQSGNLYEDSAFATQFSDYNNADVRSNIVLALANKLLKSTVFTPKE